MLVHEFLEQSKENEPEKVALVSKKYRYSYNFVDKISNKVANSILTNGFNRGDIGLVILGNSFEAVVSIFGILKAGGIFSILSPILKTRKLDVIINNCKPKVLITDKKNFDKILPNLATLSSFRFIIITDSDPSSIRSKLNKDTNLNIASFKEVIAEYGNTQPAIKLSPKDLASIIYTSGSTGKPKGALFSHYNIDFSSSAIINYLENSNKDVILNTIPLSFDYGLYQMLMAFKFKGSLILEDNFFYPQKIVDLIIREKVTGFPIIPTIAAILFRLSNLKEQNFKSLRYITNTAQALHPSFIHRLQDIFPSTKIYSMYGLTECKRVSYLPPEKLNRKPNSVGKAMPCTEAYIIDVEGHRITQADQVGELVVKGPHIMQGYWNLPKETENVLKIDIGDGRKILHTGDLFKMDKEGDLYFVGRNDDMIKVAGERVSPRVIVNVLLNIPGIEEASVVGTNDEVLGQAVYAFIVLADNSRLNIQDIVTICARELEKNWIPKKVIILDKLPKTPHGKVDKQSLFSGINNNGI